MARNMTEPTTEDAGRLQAGLGFVSRHRKALLIVALIAAGTAGILWAGVIYLPNYVRGLERYQVYRDTLLPETFPSWVTPEIKAELMVLPGVPEKFSILDPGICQTVAQAYHQNPWVGEVLRVEKRFPNRVRVELKLRRPIVGVKVGKFYYLTDSEGYRLSAPLATWPVPGVVIPLVIAPDVKITPERGRPWYDYGVLSGVAVQTYLERTPLQTRITVIDLKNLAGKRDPRESEILLWTEQNTCIYWGRSPLEMDSPGELSPMDKVAKMVDFEGRRGPMGMYQFLRIQYDEIYVGPRAQPPTVQPTGG